jgi:hypothetical protein
VISSNNFKVVPIPEEVIDFINGMSFSNKKNIRYIKNNEDNEEINKNEESDSAVQNSEYEPSLTDSNISSDDNESYASEEGGEILDVPFPEDEFREINQGIINNLTTKQVDIDEEEFEEEDFVAMFGMVFVESHEDYNIYMSIDEASLEGGDLALEGIIKEIKQIIEKDVWDPIFECNIPINYDKKHIIPAIFIVVKKTKNGKLIYKGRLCAGGHKQETISSLYTSSPTARAENILINLANAASTKARIAHVDKMGHIVLLLNGAVFYARSSKQKHITKSSTEAELVTLDDTAMVVIGVRKYLASQGYEPGSVTIYQDNKSVISLIKAGKPNNLRTKHISMKYFSIVEYIRDGLINVEWMCTEDMAADMLSKSLVGVDFEYNRNKFLIEIV